MQAAIGYPLTVHGTGGQTRAFIHIQDTVRCIQLALENPPERGDRVNVFNQMTETPRLRDLARLVPESHGRRDRLHRRTRATRPTRTICTSAHDRFLDLGLQPTTLGEGLLEEVTEIAARVRPPSATPRRFPPPRLWQGQGRQRVHKAPGPALHAVGAASPPEHVSIAGVVIAALFAAYGIYRYRGGGSRLDLLLSLLIALGVVLVSVVPQLFGILTRLLGLEDRGFAPALHRRAAPLRALPEHAGARARGESPQR